MIDLTVMLGQTGHGKLPAVRAFCYLHRYRQSKNRCTASHSAIATAATARETPRGLQQAA
jgi:hypothetical protein